MPVLVWLLAIGFAACGSPAGEPPPAASETTPPPAVPVEPAAPDAPIPSASTPQTPIASPDPALPEPPADTVVPPTPDPPTAPPEPPAAVAEPPPLFYDTYDRSGAVAKSGHYTFLADPDDPTSVVTTYEGLRDGTATALLIHTADAHEVSQAALYDVVAPGDLFEWRQANDCFVRYQVTEVKADPAGTVPQKLLAVAWMTYAFAGCSGTIATATAATLDWADLPNLGGTALATPVVHGIYQLVPENWTGATEAWQAHPPPGLDLRALFPGPGSSTDDLTVARGFRYWREPALPADWTFAGARTGGPSTTAHGYCVRYVNARGIGGVTICGDYAVDRRLPEEASWLAPGLEASERRQGVYETRVIAGRPARVAYSPPGPNHDPGLSTEVLVYDPVTESYYYIRPGEGTHQGGNIEPAIAIARSLFANPPLLLYDTYDLSGTVTKPGHYAFLADPNDPNSVVTTYEELRDGTATALLIHATDAHGISRTDLYDAVAPGDLFEWRQADDCFVRYQVMEVKLDPTGTVPQKLLAVAWMTYAFAGCAGTIATTTAATLDWGALPDLGGTSLTTPVIHGIYQIVPENWTGATEAGTGHRPPGIASGPLFGGPGSSTDDLTVARGFRYWREPALPADWTFAGARTGGPSRTARGYCATYVNARGIGGVGICGDYAVDRRWAAEASWLARTADPTGGNQGVYETRVLAGRPARVVYSPPGPNHDPWFPIAVWVYDPATESQYYISPGEDTLLGSNIDGALAIARSLFAPPNPP